jgi:hypothetical protein
MQHRRGKKFAAIELSLSLYIYIYLYMYIYVCICVHIYIYGYWAKITGTLREELNAFRIIGGDNFVSTMQSTRTLKRRHRALPFVIL